VERSLLLVAWQLDATDVSKHAGRTQHLLFLLSKPMLLLPLQCCCCVVFHPRALMKEIPMVEDDPNAFSADGAVSNTLQYTVN
jgi:hypothetical protein